MARLFFSYSHADEALRDQLEKQLAMLKRQGILETWHDRSIAAGSVIDHAISQELERADIILLLISPDFLASDYCYDLEMQRAMERHSKGEAVVIPVILRACDWHGAPFGKLLATPTDGRAIKQWLDIDEAMLIVAKAVRAAAKNTEVKSHPMRALQPAEATVATMAGWGASSSNLRVVKQFTERDKDTFRLDTFEYIAKFFEISLTKIGQRNPGIEGAFRRIDGNRFTAAIYRNGQAATRCTVFLGDAHFVRGIAFTHGETGVSNSLNECVDVHADDQTLFLRGMGMSLTTRIDSSHLSPEGAAEFYWEMFIASLQGR